MIDFNEYKKKFHDAALVKGYNEELIEKVLKYAEKLNAQDLPIIYDQLHLSFLLGIDYDYLLSVSNSPVSFYKHYEIPKRNGGTRPIEEPLPLLKEAQEWILDKILEPKSKDFVSPYAKAFMKNVSLRDNARFHRGKKVVVALDLHDFFGSVHTGAVYGIFKKMGYTKAVTTMLTKLCILRNSLPQGAPTSPMLSNMMFYNLDKTIFHYCVTRGIRYTRYADDMTFSGDDFNVRNLINYINMVVGKKRFSLNKEKTKVMGQGTVQRVTGVIVNKKLQVSKSYRDRVRQEVYYSIKYGFADHMKQIALPAWIQTPEVYRNHLLGKVNFILQINPKDEEFIRYANWLKEYSF